MIKKIILLLLIVVAGIAGFVYWKLNKAEAYFTSKDYSLFIKTGSDFNTVKQTLLRDSVLHSEKWFDRIAQKMDIAGSISAGKFTVKKNSSLLAIARLLKNGKQTPVNVVINKVRTKEGVARVLARYLESDSAQFAAFLLNNDSIATYGLDTNTVLTAIIPNTYSFLWNTPVPKVFEKLHSEHNKFWTDERKSKASALGITPVQVYSLASIIEEETNKHDEMPLMASVYLNRYNRGMPLGADPTIKYAGRNFGAKRVTFPMIDATAASPYNTYRNKGIPPGPICTPSIKTIDAVLDAASTSYLFFCAKDDFSGYHSFANTYDEHMRNARAYQKALNQLNIR